MVGGHAACSNLSFATGITSNPQHRFFNGTYGYCRVDELYGDMIVLAKGEPHLIVALEQRLIGVFQKRPGCRNVAPGGESAPTSYPSFCYVVWRFVGDGRALSLPPVDAEACGLLPDLRKRLLKKEIGS